MTEQEISLVIGGTGVVGSYIVEHLRRNGCYPFALSRSPHSSESVRWICGDLARPDELKLPRFAVLYCTADPVLLANILPRFANPPLKRVVVFSSTSVLTKHDSEVAAERDLIEKLADAEQRIRATCEARGIEWTILRPTLIYAEGRDTNITPLSRLIRRFGFMPLVGGAPGLRQPVHAEDLAIGAISAALSASAANKTYSLPGAETLTYKEMIGRIFDSLRLPRRTIPVPALLWRGLFALAKPLFPGANVAMGLRMTKDMTFDCTAAVHDFGWKPRRFSPDFDNAHKSSP